MMAPLGALDGWGCLLFGTLGFVVVDGVQLYRIHRERHMFPWELNREALRKDRESTGSHNRSAAAPVPAWSERHAGISWLIANLIRALAGGGIAVITGTVGPLSALTAAMCGIAGRLGLDRAGDLEETSRETGHLASQRVGSERSLLDPAAAQPREVKAVGDEA